MLNAFLFAGLDGIRQQLSSWEWIYGKTPRFTIRLPLDSELDQHIEIGIQRGSVDLVNFAKSGLCRRDITIWTEFLLSRKLDRHLHKTLLNIGSVIVSNVDINAKIQKLLMDLCTMCEAEQY